MDLEEVTFSANITVNGTNNFTGLVLKPDDDNIVTAITQSTLGLIGIFANLCVIIVFTTNRKLRSKIINIYIINQVRVFSY